MCLCCCKCIRGNPCAFACGHACLSWVPSCAAFALCCTPIQGRQGSFVIQFVVLSSRHALLLCGFHCRRLVSYGRAFTVLVCMRLSPAVVCVRWTGHSARVRMSSFDLSAHFCNYMCFGAFIPALPYLDKQSRRATCRKRTLDAAVYSPHSLVPYHVQRVPALAERDVRLLASRAFSRAPTQMYTLQRFEGLTRARHRPEGGASRMRHECWIWKVPPGLTHACNRSSNC